MITGWLFRIVLVFALLGFILVDAGSPLVTRAQLDDVAHDAADSAVLDLLDKNDVDRARAIAEDIAAEKDAALKSFSVDQSGVHVTVEREAWSLVLKRVEQLESWYDVEVSVTAATVRR